VDAGPVPRYSPQKDFFPALKKCRFSIAAGMGGRTGVTLYQPGKSNILKFLRWPDKSYKQDGKREGFLRKVRLGLPSK
jgi:hypothetical protein